MFEKVKGLFYVANGLSPDVVNREDLKRYTGGKALSVEETLLLASGMDLMTIKSRKNNPVFVKKASSTIDPDEVTSKYQFKQPDEGIKVLGTQEIKSEKPEEKNSFEKKVEEVQVEPLTEKALEKLDEVSDEQRSDHPQNKVLPAKLSTDDMNGRSLMKDSIGSKTVTSSTITTEVGRSSKMSCSQWSSQFINPEETSILTSENPLEYQICDSPLGGLWGSIHNEKTIAETKKRFFMSVPKPINEFRITWETTVISRSHLTLPDYYQPRKLIGRGAYAAVFEALDKRTGKVVAIKRNRGFMDNVCDAKRILRELKIWMWFNHHDICTMLDVIPILHRDIFSFEDIYIVLERMDTDLSQALKFCKLKKAHRQAIVYQLLRSLKYIHSANIIHRDLKPQNVLIKALGCNTKITDFGCSRPLGLEHSQSDVLTEYVVTRWYRSPEIYLCSHKYGKSCDLWSLGCIIAEMYRNGRPLFRGPKCHKRQLRLVFSIVGKPKKLDWIQNPRALKFMKSLQDYDPVPLDVLCPGICKEGADLLSRLLKPNPKERISLEEALAHPFVSKFRDPSTEPACQPFDTAYEKDPRVKSKRGLRMMLYETINAWHKGTMD